MYPTDFRYSKEHEWIRMDNDTATLGITDFAQQELGDIVYVELPEVGRVLKAGEVLGTVESVKAVSEIFAPVSGEVIEINEALSDTPEIVNREPHAGGWLCKLKMTDAAELETLMDAAGYQRMIGTQDG